MPLNEAEDRFSIKMYLLHTKLKPFLASLYRPAIEKATKGKHTDSMELIDKTLSLLAEPYGFVPQEELVGFALAQVDSLAKAASAVCEAWDKNEAIPFHRVMVYARRYVKVDTSPNFYDLATNSEITVSSGYAPIESLVYPLGSVYAAIISKRTERKA